MNIYDVLVESLLERSQSAKDKRMAKKSRESDEGSALILKGINSYSDRSKKARSSAEIYSNSKGVGKRHAGIKAASRSVARSASQEESSIYPEVFDIICEGLVKARNKKAGRDNLIRKAKMTGMSDPMHKGGKEGEDDTLRSIRTHRRIKANADDLEYRIGGSTKDLKRRMHNRKAYKAQRESLAYEIFDIICEGLVKAANKAKKNAYKEKEAERYERYHRPRTNHNPNEDLDDASHFSKQARLSPKGSRDRTRYSKYAKDSIKRSKVEREHDKRTDQGRWLP